MSDPIIVWVCGLYFKKVGSVSAWTIEGIFDNEHKARNRCFSFDHFIAPVEINKPYPVQGVSWPGLYYPKS